METQRRSVGALLACLALGVVMVGCSSTTSPSSSSKLPPILPTGPVGHQGRWLTDQTGRVLLPHGVNMVNKNAPYYPAADGFSAADVAWLQENGFRVVRVGVLATGLMDPTGSVDATYIQQIQRTVTALSQAGIFSLIDFHQDGYGPQVGSDGFPPSMTVTNGAVNNGVGFPLYYAENPAVQQSFQSFWDDASGSDGQPLQSDYIKMFSALASAFANNAWVIGYDLFNEPWPGTTWQPCLNDPAGCPTQDTTELAALYSRVTAAIRATGDHHLIFGEPFVLFNFGLSVTTIPLPGNDPASGMSFHLYTAEVSKEPNVLANAISWSKTTGGALLNTEFGATQSTAAIARQVDELDTALVPWIFWSFDGEVVPNINKAIGPGNISTSAVKGLLQAYPLAVAGTPTSLVYSADGSVNFDWNTSKAGGGSFPDGTVTTFEVPKGLYGAGGYVATATGGAITSKPCAALLTIISGTAAQSVEVTIGPGKCTASS